MTNRTHEIEQLEKYFQTAIIPKGNLKLNAWTNIVDCKLFITSHLIRLKANINNKTFEQYFDRLNELKNFIDKNL